MYTYIKNLIQKWFENAKSPIETYLIYNEISQELYRQYRQKMDKFRNEIYSKED